MDPSTAPVGPTPIERLLTRTRPAATPSVEDDPSRVGRYRIEGRLGVGGMGVVYEAHDTKLDRPVALKLMLVDDEAERARLRREAQALARLSHPNVVDVFEIDEHEGRPFVAMALVRGYTLGQWLKLRRRPAAQILDVFVQAGEGLAAAHAHGLVHRDFKPGNVLVGIDGRVRVVDFGLVRDSGGVEEVDVSSEGPAVLSSMSSGPAWSEPLTKTGSMVGTPAYMSPEVLSSMPAGPASDQFSFCASLYEALYRRHPFVEGDKWAQLPYNVLEGELQRPEGTPPGGKALLRVIERGLQLRPAERWPSMGELLQQLRATQVPHRSWRGMVLAGVGALVLAGVMLDSSTTPAVAVDPCEQARATMQSVWTPARRDALRTAWDDAAPLGAAETWSRVDTRLSAHVAGWWRAHREACEAPRAEAVDEIATCLHRLAQGLDAKLEVLAAPDSTLVSNAVQMVSRLPPPQACGQPMQGVVGLDRAASPYAAELDRIAALYDAGRYEEVVPLVEQLVATTELEGSLKSRARAQLWLGHAAQMRSEPDRAGEAFEEAYLLAKQSGHDRLAAEAALSLLVLYGEHYYRAAEAERWDGHAKAEVERLDDRILLASYLNATGRALRSKGDLPAALDHHRRALAIQREELPDDHLDLAISLFQIGTVEGLLGNVAMGRQSLEGSLAIVEAHYGARHPRVLRPLTNIGVFLQEEGRLDEARTTYEQVLSIMDEYLPSHPRARLVPLTNLSHIYKNQGHPERAADALRKFLRGYEDAGLPAEESTAEGFRCEIAILEADYAQAERRCRRAASLYEGVLGPEHGKIAEAMGKQAQALGRLGRVDEALSLFERVTKLDEDRAELGTRRTNLLWMMSELELSRGRIDEAIELLSRAHDAIPRDAEPPGRFDALSAELRVELASVRIERDGPEPRWLEELRAAARQHEDAIGTHEHELVHTLVRLARAERRVGRLEPARAAAERALAVVEPVAASNVDDVARARAELAQSLGALGIERAHARELAEQARQTFLEGGGFVQRELEQLEAWMQAQGWLAPVSPAP